MICMAPPRPKNSFSKIGIEAQPNLECGMVNSGVPQGTVLVPLLFLIYINDIESQITSSIRLFADDSALCRPIYTESDSLSLQEDILNLQKLPNTWQMAFNVNKCKLHVSLIANQV